MTALSAAPLVELSMDAGPSTSSGRTAVDATARLDSVLAYHTRTKHHIDRYAAGPGTLDWDAQPDPFRHWTDAQTLALPRHLPDLGIAWDALSDARPAAPLDVISISTLLRLSVSITAWKEYAGARWALRANPSSGNLHPTETWVIASGVKGVTNGLHHYQSQSHRLERRAWNDEATAPGLWLGFSSIHWREAWKYGERAFRYCQLDLGHALAAVSYAAALLGWRVQVLRLDSSEVAARLGLDRAADFAGVEAEEPEVIVALDASASLPASWLHPPQGGGHDCKAAEAATFMHYAGKPSLLDPRPLYQWPVIEEVATATRGTPPTPDPSFRRKPESSLIKLDPGLRRDDDATQIIFNRRSAQAFDGKSILPHAVFRRLLSCLLPGGSPVWGLWPHAPRVHPVLLVHRVEDVAPGLYALPRSEAALAALRETCRAEFNWDAADAELPLFQLIQAAAAKTARTLSCHQDIALHSAVTFMFVAEFDAPIAENPAAYRHLHWEAGMLGHVVTLEAEAASWRGTGIGCFFDDAGHDVLGFTDTRFQVLYHFAVGMPVDDPRLLTRPAYE